ncbi:MAG: glycerophosphodiester phosphodiesterase family protein [Chromatiales bacterium]|nr:glycerophosphodiester phosphodiesterase family protein [Chromatiales bacterium]
MTPNATHATPAPRLIAHRGWASRYPENSLEALEAALDAGARFVEFDVQLSADGVPVLLHDSTLDRTAALPGCVHDMDWGRLAEIRIGESTRLGDAYAQVRLPSLAQACRLLESWPGARAFVEIKTESLQRFGLERVLDRCLEQTESLGDRGIITSYSDDLLSLAREKHGQAIAWVLTTADQSELEHARKLAPDYLFCNVNKLPGEGPLPCGPWQWAIYEITDPDQAVGLARRGAALVETMAIGEMLRDPRLSSGPAVD